MRTTLEIDDKLLNDIVELSGSSLLIASVALQRDVAVYTPDEHFNRVDGRRLHTPGSVATS